ncbi:MAG: hypothetical protein P4M10_03460, partial [Verrucomicrobiae bacterium]|nr:hypothetical protein [Verrucomicrobiae bacterium]
LPVWYLEAAIFLCGILLWGFVFAWHTPYTGRPVFVLKLEPRLWLAATGAGVVAALFCHFWLDPVLRPRFPKEYPEDLTHWLAAVPFILSLNQLLLILAPFDWLLRLIHKPWVAAALAAVFGVALMASKISTQAAPVPPVLFLALMAVKLAGGLLAVFFYLRGGVLLVWWWALLLESRHLFYLLGGS